MNFNRFTQRAKKAIDLAFESAKSLGHNIVGSEHILLGLLREEEGIAAKVLSKVGFTEAYLEGKIVDMEGKGKEILECEYKRLKTLVAEGREFLEERYEE